MTKYIFETMDMMDQVLVFGLIRKNIYLNSYLKKVLFQAYFFNYFSIQNSFLLIYQNVVKLLVQNIKFEKRKSLKQRLNKEVMSIAQHPRRQ